MNDLADFDFVFLLDLGHDAFATVYFLIGRSFQLMLIMDCGSQCGVCAF